MLLTSLPVPPHPRRKPVPEALTHTLPPPTHSPSLILDGLCGAIHTPAPQVFGIILVSVFAYDAFKIYRTEIASRATQGECLSSGRGGALHPCPSGPSLTCPFLPGSIFTGDQQ